MEALEPWQKNGLGLPPTFGEGVASVFSVPKSPGRLYVEADCLGSVLTLVRGTSYVYTAMVFSVPLAERVALLQPSSQLPPFSIGNYVSIRNGLYKNDTGEVVQVEHEGREVTVKLKSREPNLRHVANRKRKRRPQRTEPYVLEKEKISKQFNGEDTAMEGRITRDFAIEDEFEDLGDSGFVFQGKHYANDGYLLIQFRSDRLERVREPSSPDHRPPDTYYSEDTVRRRRYFNHRDGRKETVDLPPAHRIELDRADVPKYIRHGDRVRVLKGEQRGVIGKVIEIITTAAYPIVLVDVGKHDRQSRRPIIIETSLDDLDRVFDYGEVVEVQYGKYKGRVGTVAFCEGGRLGLIGLRDFIEVRNHASITCNGS